MSSPSGPSQLTSQTADPSSNLKSMLDAALIKYKKQTGEDLQAIWLASELQSCESINSVLDILRDQANALDRSGDRKLMAWIDPLVHVLYTFSGALGDGVSLAFPPAKVIFTGIGVLLGAAKDARASQDNVIDLFERIESFFKRLEVYNQISLTTKMAEVLVKIVIELLSILSIATKEVRRRRAKLFARKLLGRTDIEDALKRLDRLIQEEFQMVTAQILKVANEGKDGADKANIALQQVLSDVEEVKCDVVEVKSLVKSGVAEVKTEVVEMKTEVVEVKNEVQELKWAQIEQDIHKWFSPPDPYTNYNIACEAQSEGTAAWFFQGTKFKDWTSIGSLLWIHGKPGSGKSILCSAVVKHLISLRDAGQVSLAFFYFDFRDEEKKQDLRNFVTSLLCQLSAYSNLCCEIISRIYSTHGKGTQQPSNSALANCLREMLSVSVEQPIYIIVDALDECPNSSGIPTPREVVLNLLEGLVRLGQPSLHICVTSRPEADIKDVLGPLARTLSLHDEIGQKRDISDYVGNFVAFDRMMRRWRSAEKELVVKELSDKADGMFRWVFCQLEVLRHCLPASIRKTLDQLPKSLDDTYLRVLRQIPQANQAHAHRMLQCLVVAVRPLRVEELAELLAFEFDGAPGGIPKYRPGLRVDDQTQAVLSTCSSLVTIIDEWYGYDNRHFRRVAQFSHFSVKEFLVSNHLAPSLGDITRYRIRLGSAHTTLTQACLGLLLHSDNHTEESVEQSPLTDYAAKHWVEHAQFEDVASHVKDGMETLFDSRKPHFGAWVKKYDIDGRTVRSLISKSEIPREIPSPLYYSVLCGFYDLVEHLAITHPHHVNAFGGIFWSPLLAALCQGHVEVAELLLKHGADVDVRESTGKTTLLLALSSLKRHDHLVNLVEFLLTHGADVNARDDAFATSLHLAEEYGIQQVVTILLKHKVDVNSQDKNGKTPLHRLLGNAGYNDDSDHVRLLLEHGAELNRRDKANQTPFLLAMKSGWFRAAQILLEHGADPVMENNNGESPWHLLSESRIYDEDEVLDHAMLLSKLCVKVNRCDRNKETPLHLAIRRNRFRLAEFLLEHGADANAENDLGMTPLCVLPECWIYDEGAVLDHALLLLKHGAQVDKRDKDSQTPLHLATIRRNRSKLIGILLEHGADANAENIQGMTSLHMLPESQIYDEGTVPDYALLLLKHGAEVNRRDKANQTPLHLAIRMNQVKLVGILLEHGADANAEDIQGMASLHMLPGSRIYEGTILDYALLLLKHGAEVNRRDKANQTPLHLATRMNQFRLAEFLLEHGADANAENNNAMTPLHTLLESQGYDEGDVLDHALLLLKHGAEVNRRDKDSQTPFLLATERGWFELALILLELGADANAANKSGKTPLHILSELEIYDKSDVGDVLTTNRTKLEHGAEVSRQCKGDRSTLLPQRDAPVENKTPMYQVRGQYDTQGPSAGVSELLPERNVDIHAQDLNHWHMKPSYLQSKIFPVKFAQVLLDHGANVNAGNNGGKTSSDQGLEGLHVQNMNGWTPLHSASWYGRLDIARVLLEHGATSNSKDDFGRTPLHLVAGGIYNFEQDRVCIVRLLLERSADVNARDEGNATPLNWASFSGKAEIVRVLLDHGAAVDSKGYQGRTPLHSAAEGTSRCLYSDSEGDGIGIGIARLLLEHGADANAQDEDHLTPLHLASYYGAIEISRELLDGGANANSKSNHGRTPLHTVAEGGDYYSRNNDVLVTRLLLERGAEVNVPDVENQTPLHLASYFGKAKMIKELLSVDADTNAKNAQGQTPFDLALQNSQLDFDIVVLLCGNDGSISLVSL